MTYNYNQRGLLIDFSEYLYFDHFVRRLRDLPRPR